jgi:tetratricopeptide (TPR) repeat protein
VRPEGDEFLFAHALIRDSVYASMTKQRRRTLHRAIADRLRGRDSVLRAEHLDRAEDPGAALAYLEAAQACAKALDLTRALALAERGRQLAKEAADRIDVALYHGRLLLDAGDGTRALEAFSTVLGLAVTQENKCRAQIGVAGAYRLMGAIEKGMKALAEAEPIADEQQNADDLAELHYLRGSLHFARGEHARCRAEHEVALNHAHRARNPEWEARALSGLADADYAVGRMRTAIANFESCVAHCESHGFVRIALVNRLMTAYCIFLLEFEKSLSISKKCLAIARKLGSRYLEMNALYTVADALMGCGRMREAVAIISETEQTAREIGARRFLAGLIALRVEAQWQAGQSAEAPAQLGSALDLAKETGIGFVGPYIMAVMAKIAPDSAARRDALAAGEAMLVAGALSHNHFHFRRIAIEVGLEQGDWALALHHAAALEAYCIAEPLP